MPILNLTDLSDEPLHGQISRQLRAQILAGHLPPNSTMPSIRAMAREQRVSVITVQRAYDDLEREGLLISRRGKGFFVAELPKGQRQERAQAKAMDSLSGAAQEAMADGLTPDQILDLLARILKDGGNR